MSARRARRRVLAALVVVATLVVGPEPVLARPTVRARSSPAPHVSHGERYRPPTNGEVLDPFRPPPAPWLAGNRGIEYRTEPGAALRAIGSGVVTFAGSVARRLVVTVRHPDGLRSSLTGVALLVVRAGDHIVGGQVIAGAAATVHLGVRRGTTYLDPASLWGRPVGGGRVYLVALHAPCCTDLVTLGRSGGRRYTRTSVHRPVGRVQTSPVPTNGRLRNLRRREGAGIANRWRGAP